MLDTGWVCNETGKDTGSIYRLNCFCSTAEIMLTLGHDHTLSMHDQSSVWPNMCSNDRDHAVKIKKRWMTLSQFGSMSHRRKLECRLVSTKMAMLVLLYVVVGSFHSIGSCGSRILPFWDHVVVGSFHSRIMRWLDPSFLWSCGGRMTPF